MGMRMGVRMNENNQQMIESMNVRTPPTDKGWFYVIHGDQEPLGLPPRSSRNCYSPLSKNGE
jgi:hypothetical protein